MHDQHTREPLFSADIPLRSRERLFELIRQLNEKDIIFVLDESTAKNLTSCMRLNDLFDIGVFLVEDLHKKRKPFPHYCVIYFVSSIEETIGVIANDWAPAKPSYRVGHIFYTEPPSDAFWEKSAKLRSNPSIKSMHQIFLAFRCVDTFAFHLNWHLDLACFLSQTPEDESERASQKLFNVLEGLQFLPSVRSQQSFIARTVAHKLAERFKGMHRAESDTFTQCEMIVLDRTVDLCAPLTHDFSYENLFQDLCMTESGLKTPCKHLDHSHWDSIWRTVRHLNIDKAREKLKAFYIEFKKQSEMNKSADERSTSMLAKIAHEAPEHQKFVKELETHMTALENIYSQQKRTKFIQVFQIEQMLIRKLREDDLSLSADEVDGFLNEIATSEFSSNVKFRVLLLFALTQVAGKNERILRYMNAAGIPHAKLTTIKKLQMLHANVGKKSLGDSGKKTQREESGALSRFPTRLKQIVEAMIKGSLSAESFPYVDWAGKGAVSALDCNTSVLKQNPLIVLVIGGFCRSELHDIRRLMEATGRPIVLCGTSLVSARRLVDQIDLISMA